MARMMTISGTSVQGLFAVNIFLTAGESLGAQVAFLNR
jgi:hypothetical protein